MPEREFKIIKWFGNKVPAMASCTQCQYKFVTPNSLKRDPEAAEKYLREKFNFHECREPDRPKDGKSVSLDGRSD
jgi:hypothetical protein